MKRVLSVLIILMNVVAFSTAEINKQIVNFFTPGIPEISLKQNIQLNLVEDSKEAGLGVSTVVLFDLKELQGDLGFNYTNKQLDFTSQIIYWPTFFEFINFGVGVTYHLCDYPKIFIEQDFLADVYLKMQVNQYFMFWLRYGYLYKNTKIKDLPVKFKMQEECMNFNVNLTVTPFDLWSFYFSFDSTSYFNYPNFLTVFFNTGAEYEIMPEKLSVGIDVCTKWYDFVVVVQNLSQMNVKLFGKYKI